MGFWKRVLDVVRRPFTGGRSSPPPAPPPAFTPDDSPDWGRPVSADSEAWTTSNNGHDFSFSVVGWKEIQGPREDLEKDPARTLTDAELRRADYVVVHFSGAMGYKVIGGPWEDWEDFWDDVASYYDIYGE
jgi:hypothetical protein